jgi:hypothetical protein
LARRAELNLASRFYFHLFAPILSLCSFPGMSRPPLLSRKFSNNS